MNALRNIKMALAVTICAFAVAAAYISYAVVERQNFLREVSRYNVVWASSQALVELQRLTQRVAAFGIPDSGITMDEVQLRFDIMFNRLDIFRSGDVAAFIERDPEQRAVVDQLAAVLVELEPMIPALDRPGMISKVLARLDPLEDALTRFAAAANQFGGAQVADDQRMLLELHWTFSAVAAGLVLCGLAFIGLLLFQNRVIRRAHDALRLLTDDLHAAKDAAEAASEAKSRFLANMSHELRTPLNAIIGFSELIAKEMLGPIGQPKYKDYAADILKSGNHMFELVSDILTMAKLEAGHYDMLLQPCDLRAQVEATLGIFRGTEMARERDVAVEEGGDWPQIRVDERALRQMLLNLLSNAVKFSAKDTPVRIAARHTASGGVRLTVADRGVGMTAQQAQMAVQPFHQVDSGLARKYEGTGLGLSIVKAMIERHGGELQIASEPGAGSRISLVFPRDLVEPAALAKVA